MTALAQALLARGAEVSRSARDHNPANRLLASGARLALSCVDEELVLHLAGFATRVSIVVDRGSTSFDPALERLDDRLPQWLPVLGAR